MSEPMKLLFLLILAALPGWSQPGISNFLRVATDTANDSGFAPISNPLQGANYIVLTIPPGSEQAFSFRLPSQGGVLSIPSGGGYALGPLRVGLNAGQTIGEIRASSGAVTVQIVAQIIGKCRSCRRGVFGGSGGGAVSPSLVTDNLVSEWRFDEGSGDTLTDYVGSNDGQLGSSAGADANDPDWVTAGLDFANSADRVQLPITFDPNGAFSLSLVGYYDNTLATGATIWSQQDGTGTGRSIMLISHELDDLCSFLGGTEVCGSQTVTTGWHQYTLTYDGAGTLTFYVDGDSGATQSATPEAANGAHWIGLNKAGVAVFNEPIAWALYYDDELTAAENNSNCQYLAGAVASRGVSLTCQ